MYRQYENPRTLEQQLEYVKAEFDMRISKANSKEQRYELIEMYSERISSLEERINFAWQDEEFAENCARYGY